MWVRPLGGWSRSDDSLCVFLGVSAVVKKIGNRLLGSYGKVIMAADEPEINADKTLVFNLRSSVFIGGPLFF
jgi:hypothetical protein